MEIASETVKNNQTKDPASGSLRKMFDSADLNKDKKISPAEFEAFVARKFGVSRHACQSMFQKLDRNKDSFLDFEEFQDFASPRIEAQSEAKVATTPACGVPKAQAQQPAIALPVLSRPMSARLPPSSEAVLAKCVVKIWTHSCGKSYHRPWTVLPTRGCTGTGFVVDKAKRFIITNAHVVVDHAAVQVRLYGQHERIAAQVLFISQEMDLALLTVNRDDFWEHANTVAQFAEKLPTQFEPTVVIGYPLGGTTISMTKGVVSRVDCKEYNFHAEEAPKLLIVQIDAAINSGNSGGPVFNMQGQVVGVAFSGLDKKASEGVGYIIPVPVVQSFLRTFAMTDKGVTPFRGVCSAGFNWQSTENPALRASLGMDRTDTRAPASGVLINSVSQRGSAHGILRANDVIMAIDGNAIGYDGTFRLRGNDRLRLDHLITSKVVGSPISFSVLRNGAVVQCTSVAQPMVPTMPEFDGRDCSPEYFVVGGLVFVPATRPLLRQTAKIGPQMVAALLERERMGRTTDDIIVLASVLPHDINFGYPTPSCPLRSLNGDIVRSLRDLVRIVQHAIAADSAPGAAPGFFEFEFGQTRDTVRIVLSIADCRQRGAEILRRYNVPASISPKLAQAVAQSDETAAAASGAAPPAKAEDNA